MNSKKHLDLEVFTDTLLMLFNEYSEDKLKHWERFGREHPNFATCQYFHSGNFDGFMMWLIDRSKYGKTETRAAGDSSERMDSPEERSPVSRN